MDCNRLSFLIRRYQPFQKEDIKVFNMSFFLFPKREKINNLTKLFFRLMLELCRININRGYILFE